jgi:hypothetical protein
MPCRPSRIRIEHGAIIVLLRIETLKALGAVDIHTPYTLSTDGHTVFVA